MLPVTAMTHLPSKVWAAVHDSVCELVMLPVIVLSTVRALKSTYACMACCTAPVASAGFVLPGGPDVPRNASWLVNTVPPTVPQAFGGMAHALPLVVAVLPR